MTDNPAADATSEERPTQVTALVVLRPPGGGTAVDGEPISRRQLDRIIPAERDVAVVADGLRALGFDVGPMLGISMSITSRQSTFESVFGVRVEHDGGIWKVSDQQSPDGDQPADVIAHDALDAAIASRIDRVIFEPPMELHEEPTWTF